MSEIIYLKVSILIVISMFVAGMITGYKKKMDYFPTNPPSFLDIMFEMCGMGIVSGAATAIGLAILFGIFKGIQYVFWG